MPNSFSIGDTIAEIAVLSVDGRDELDETRRLHAIKELNAHFKAMADGSSSGRVIYSKPAAAAPCLPASAPAYPSAASVVQLDALIERIDRGLPLDRDALLGALRDIRESFHSEKCDHPVVAEAAALLPGWHWGVYTTADGFEATVSKTDGTCEPLTIRAAAATGHDALRAAIHRAMALPEIGFKA